MILRLEICEKFVMKYLDVRDLLQILFGRKELIEKIEKRYRNVMTIYYVIQNLVKKEDD